MLSRLLLQPCAQHYAECPQGEGSSRGSAAEIGVSAELPAAISAELPTVSGSSSFRPWGAEISSAETSEVRGCDEAGGEGEEAEAAIADTNYTSADAPDDSCQDYGTFRVSL